MSEDTNTKNNIQPISLPGGHGFKLGIDKTNNELYWGYVSGTDYTLIAGGEKDPTVQSWARISYDGKIPISTLPTISGNISGNISDEYLATNLAIANYVSGYIATQLVEAGAHTHANKDLLDNISTYIDDKVDKVDGKGLSTNDFTTDYKDKLDSIAASAQVNIIESITVNGNTVNIENKTADITIDIPVNSDFTLSGLSEKSYNSLTDKPTLSGKYITGSIDNNLTEFVKHVIPVENSIKDNDVNSTNVPNINAVTSYVDDRITQLNNFNGNYNSLTNLPTINNNIISGEISGNIKSVISETVSISTSDANDDTGTITGTILNWNINGKPGQLNIAHEKWLSSVKYDDTKDNEKIIFTVTNGNEISIPVTEFINEYTSNDFSLNELKEKSYNSLTDKPTISGTDISGEISGLINSVIPIATNETVGLVKGSNSVQIDEYGTMTVIASGIVMENANHANIADIAKATSGTLTIFGTQFNGSEDVSISAEIFGTKPDTNNYLSGSTVYDDLSALDTTIKTLADKATNVSISVDTTNTAKDILNWSIDGETGSLDINKYSAGNGIALTDNKFSLTKDNNGDSKFLQINDNSIGLSGITDAITNATVASANKLTTAHNITLAGVISGSAAFDGSDNITINTKLDNVTIDPSMIDGLTLTWDDVTEKPIVSGELINAPLSAITTVSSVTNYVSGQVSGKVDKIDGKGLSTNDFTTAEMTKLSGIEAGAEVNIIDAITVNGNDIDITDKTANIEIPSEILYYNGTNKLSGQLIISGTTGSNVDGGYVKLKSDETEIDLSLPIIDNLSAYADNILSGCVVDALAIKNYVQANKSSGSSFDNEEILKQISANIDNRLTYNNEAYALSSEINNIDIYNVTLTAESNKPENADTVVPSVSVMMDYVSSMIEASYGDIINKLNEIVS